MRTLHQLRAAAIAAIGMLALAACDDGPEVRVITPDSATSTCIGDPKTPECAVETVLACIARVDLSLCELAIHGAGGSICKSHPELGPCATYLDELAGSAQYLAAVGRASEISSYDPRGMYVEMIELESWPAPVWSKHSYRIRRIGEVEDKVELHKLVGFKMVPDIDLLEVDVDRWVCTRRVPADPLIEDRSKFQEFKYAGLPVDEPGKGIRTMLRSLWRRAETIAWEHGLAREPFYWVWYDVGADYCWEPLKYWVGTVDGQWFVVRWTLEDQGFCDLACGCPDYRWPPFRKIREGNCAPIGDASE